MSFITPMLAVAGVLAMTLPIIIHLLFRRRRRTVPWAAMRFLLEALRKHRRRLQLEQLILLIVRCLALGLLGAALAQPLLRDSGMLDLGGSRAVIFVVDNGLNAGLTNVDGTTSLQRHTEAARAMLKTLRPNDGVSVLTTARPAQAMVSPPSSDHGKIRDMLERMQASPAASDMPRAVERLDQAIADALERHDQVVVYLLSDFRAGSAALDRPLTATLTSLNDRVSLYYATPDAASIENVGITSVTPMRHVVLPGTIDGSGQTTVRLARSGGELGRTITTVRMTTDGPGQIEPVIINWEPGQTEAAADFLLAFDGLDDRDVAITASIDTDAIAHDDTRHAVLSVRRRVRLVLIERRAFGASADVTMLTPGEWIRRALEPFQQRSPMEFITVEPGALSAPDIRLADAAVLTRPDLVDANGWSLLREYVDDGGVLLVTPPAEPRVHRWTESMIEALSLSWRVQVEIETSDTMRLADEQPQTSLLRMVSSELNDLARPIMVHRWLPIDDDQTDATTILRLADGAPFVISGAPIQTTDEDGNTLSEGVSGDETNTLPARGMVMLMASAPELSWTNLPTKPLIVPLFQELVRQGLSQVRHGGDAVVGVRTASALSGAAASMQLRDTDSDQVFVNDDGRFATPVASPGVYEVRDRASQPLGLLAANVEAWAGQTDVQTPAAVAAWLGKSGPWQFMPDQIEATAALDEAAPTSGLARWALLAVIVLLILETAMARWFSHANIHSADVVQTEGAKALGAAS